MVPRWDIHPEMVSPTRLVDLATGRPVPDASPAAMENWYPATRKSVDELAAYMAYAPRILRNCDLHCEGITTPGGFGNGVESELSLGVGEAVGDVFAAEVPHYFKYVAEGTEDPRPAAGSVAGPGTSRAAGRSTSTPRGGPVAWSGSSSAAAPP
jgi:hypothetical protein